MILFYKKKLYNAFLHRPVEEQFSCEVLQIDFNELFTFLA